MCDRKVSKVRMAPVRAREEAAVVCESGSCLSIDQRCSSTLIRKLQLTPDVFASMAEIIGSRPLSLSRFRYCIHGRNPYLANIGGKRPRTILRERP